VKKAAAEKGKKSDSVEDEDLLTVEVLEPKPNPMFTEATRQWVRFLRFNHYVPCAECGKMKKTLWTMLVEFYAFSMDPEIIFSETLEKKHAPLTPVCGDHPLAPAFPKNQTKKR
jgi:hypothetical protein